MGERERAGCFTLFVILVSCDFYATLPQGLMSCDFYATLPQGARVGLQYVIVGFPGLTYLLLCMYGYRA